MLLTSIPWLQPYLVQNSQLVDVEILSLGQSPYVCATEWNQGRSEYPPICWSNPHQMLVDFSCNGLILGRNYIREPMDLQGFAWPSCRFSLKNLVSVTFWCPPWRFRLPPLRVPGRTAGWWFPSPWKTRIIENIQTVENHRRKYVCPKRTEPKKKWSPSSFRNLRTCSTRCPWKLPSTPPIAGLGSSWRTPCPCRCSMRSAQWHAGTRWAGRPQETTHFVEGISGPEMPRWFLNRQGMKSLAGKLNDSTAENVTNSTLNMESLEEQKPIQIEKRTCHAMCHTISYIIYRMLYVKHQNHISKRVYHKSHIKNHNIYIYKHHF